MDKAQELIGHVPEVELEDGLRRYVAWYRELTSRPAEPVLS
jgi:nucleoside-diphosphate-sugar epimerase